MKMHPLIACMVAAPFIAASALPSGVHVAVSASDGFQYRQANSHIIRARAQFVSPIVDLKLSRHHDAFKHLYPRSHQEPKATTNADHRHKESSTPTSQQQPQVPYSVGSNQERLRKSTSIINNPFYQLESHNSLSQSPSSSPHSPFQSQQRQQQFLSHRAGQYNPFSAPKSHGQEPWSAEGSPKLPSSPRKQGVVSIVKNDQKQQPPHNSISFHQPDTSYQVSPFPNSQLTFHNTGGNYQPSSPSKTQRESTFVVSPVRTIVKQASQMDPPKQSDQQQPPAFHQKIVNVKYPPPIFGSVIPHDQSGQGTSKDQQPLTFDQRQQPKHSSSDQSTSNKAQVLGLDYHRTQSNYQLFESQQSLAGQSTNSRQPFLPYQASTVGSGHDIGDHQPKSTWYGQAKRILKIGLQGTQNNPMPVVASAMGMLAPALGAAGVITNNTALIIGGTTLGMGAGGAATWSSVKDGWEKKKEQDRQRQRSEELRRLDQKRAGYKNSFSEEPHDVKKQLHDQQQNQLEQGVLPEYQRRHSRRATDRESAMLYGEERGGSVSSDTGDRDEVLSGLHRRGFLHLQNYGLQSQNHAGSLRRRRGLSTEGLTQRDKQLRSPPRTKHDHIWRAHSFSDTPSMPLLSARVTRGRTRRSSTHEHHRSIGRRLSARGLGEINPSAKNEDHLYRLLRTDSSNKRLSPLDSSITGYLDQSGHSTSPTLMYPKGLHGGPSMDVLRSDDSHIDSQYAQRITQETHQQPYGSPRSQISQHSLQQTLNTRPEMEHLDTQTRLGRHSQTSNAQPSNTQNNQQSGTQSDTSQKQTQSLHTGKFHTTHVELQPTKNWEMQRLKNSKIGSRGRRFGVRLNEKAKEVIKKAGNLAGKFKKATDRTASRKSCLLCAGRGAPAPSDMETVKPFSEPFQSQQGYDPVKSIFGHLLSADQGNVGRMSYVGQKEHSISGATLSQNQPTDQRSKNSKRRQERELKSSSTQPRVHPRRASESEGDSRGKWLRLHRKAEVRDEKLKQRSTGSEIGSATQQSHGLNQQHQANRKTNGIGQEQKIILRSMRSTSQGTRSVKASPVDLEDAVQRLSSKALRGIPRNQDIPQDTKGGIEQFIPTHHPPNVDSMGVQGLTARSKGPIRAGVEMQKLTQENLAQQGTSKIGGPFSSSPSFLSASEILLGDTQHQGGSPRSQPSSPEKFHPPGQTKFNSRIDSSEHDSCHASIGKVKELIKAEMSRVALYPQHSQPSSKQDAWHHRETLDQTMQFIHAETSRLEHKLYSDQLRMLDRQEERLNEAHQNSRKRENCNILIGCLVCSIGQIGLWGSLVTAGLSLQSSAECLTTAVGVDVAWTSHLCRNSADIEAAIRELQEHRRFLREQMQGGSGLRRVGSTEIGGSTKLTKSGSMGSRRGSQPNEEGNGMPEIGRNSMHRRDEAERGPGEESTESEGNWLEESWAPGIVGQEELDDGILKGDTEGEQAQ